ncbi:MAG TPA: helix-turn-helix transcriptional regulator [Armatimonadota bacterium]|nr:helix-turn-helix transcriptional regulator [Armatimonadota bacterium]
MAEQTYGESLRQMRENGKLTMTAAARKMRVPRATWWRWETDRTVPTPMYDRILSLLARDYGVRLPTRPVREKGKDVITI